MDKFKYLGSWITSDGRSDVDIKCRIGQEKQMFMNVNNVPCAKKMRLGIKGVC